MSEMGGGGEKTLFQNPHPPKTFTFGSNFRAVRVSKMPAFIARLHE